jgi:SAM-dependent methyltransferase
MKWRMADRQAASPAARRVFYERYQDSRGAIDTSLRSETAALLDFVQRYQLGESRILEVGCGRGAFQELADGWVGIDLAVGSARFVHKPFVVASADALPFRTGSFAGAWSITVLEHVPAPERALEEIVRVLRPGGVAYLAPAWHCRPWAAEGIHVRTWGELSWRQRLVKLTLPMREAFLFRAIPEVPRRLWQELRLVLSGKPLRLRYGRLRPSYDVFWGADSDACASLDPHAVLAWFVSRGFESPSHPRRLRRLLARHGGIVVRKP